MPPPTALLLHGALVIERADLDPRPADVLVAEGRILAIAPALSVPPGVDRYDATGLWIAPGLVDAHVHLRTVPGEAWLPSEALAPLRRAQLASYPACGVTTVLDAGSTREDLHSLLLPEGPAPRVLHLGRALGPAGGYPEVHDPAGFPGLASHADLVLALDEARDRGAVGAKFTIEEGFAGEHFPLFDPAFRADIVQETEIRDLPRFVHAMTTEAYRLGLDLEPRAFVHGPDKPDAAVARAVAEAGAFVISTQVIYQAPLNVRSPPVLDDPLLRACVPPPLVAAAGDRATAVRARVAMAELAVPWAPRWLAGAGVGARWIARQKLHGAQRAIRQLHAQGVDLVLGTDSGTWPVFHGMFHGFAAHQELDLLAEAGLSPREVMAAATLAPARMLGLEGELGVLVPGGPADLVLLRADPLADVGAWHQLVATMRAGELRTPEGWTKVDEQR